MNPWGPITWSIFNPGVELSPVDRIEILYDYMEDFNPGVEILYVPAIGSKMLENVIKGAAENMKRIAMFVCFSIWGVNNLDITV